MYATFDRMLSRFGEGELIMISDLSHGGTVDMHRLQAAIDMANAEVNGYVAARYGATAAANALVAGLACDIARYHSAVACVRVTERDEVRYRTAVKTLATIADGKLSLGAANVAAPMATAPTADLAMMAKSNSSPFSNGGW